MGDLAMEEDHPILPSFAAPLCNPDPNSIRPETWVVAEDPVSEVLNCIHPTLDCDEKRKDVIEYVQKLIRRSLRLEVFPYGSVPLKTYLPDGDIDLTVLSTPNLDEILPREVLRVLQEEEHNGNTEFVLKDTQFIDAEVKLVKCLVQDIVIDISFNQLGGLCTLCFLEQVDRLVSKDHLFKRSIILIKAWCYYESRILGAHHGLISTYALETLVLYIFHVFHAALNTPAEVLYKFLDYYSKFDWDNYCISLDGPVSKSSLPNLSVENPDNEGTNVLLSEEFRKKCMDMLILPSKGLETDLRGFTLKHLNIIDPLKENNNLGRSVHRGNYYRIRSAFRFGARKLGRILQLPSSSIGDEIKKFFTNTLQRHKPKYGPEATLIYGVKGFGTLPLTEPYYEDDTYSRLSNGDSDDYMNDVSTMASTEATNLSKFRSLTLKSDNNISDSSLRISHVGNSHNVHLLGNKPNIEKGPIFEHKPSGSISEKKTGLELWMERGASQLVDGDTICLCLNKNNSDGLSFDVREKDATDGIGEPDILNPFADLMGDYDAHIRNLLYGKGVHGYSLSAAMVRTSPPTSPYGTKNPWEAAAGSWSAVPFQQNSSQVSSNGLLMGHPTYLNGTNVALRGTGPYIPVTSSKERPHTRGGRGRGRGPAVSNGHGLRSRGSTGDVKLVVEANNHTGQGPLEWSPRLARGNSDPSSQPHQLPSPVNSTANGATNQPRKLEFGSFRSSPENPSSPSYVKSPRLNPYGKKQGRNGQNSFHLKNEEEFPPLST